MEQGFLVLSWLGRLLVVSKSIWKLGGSLSLLLILSCAIDLVELEFNRLCLLRLEDGYLDLAKR